MENVWKSVESYRKSLTDAGVLAERRGKQAHGLKESEMIESILQTYQQDKKLAGKWQELQQDVVRGVRSPGDAARILLGFYQKRD